MAAKIAKKNQDDYLGENENQNLLHFHIILGRKTIVEKARPHRRKTLIFAI